MLLATLFVGLMVAPSALADRGPPKHAHGRAQQAPAALAKALGQTCVEYSTQVIYKNYGYDHWVHLRSACEKPVTCHASSDSNPSGADRALDPGESASLLMFRGSPASEFQATVSCRLR
ncbi:MAG: hypothetical protein KC766_19050 [Myxococcales bacterium]|nr:hypothetical protein [Myxococcales bacterium]